MTRHRNRVSAGMAASVPIPGLPARGTNEGPAERAGKEIGGTMRGAPFSSPTMPVARSRMRRTSGNDGVGREPAGWVGAHRT